MRKLIYIAVCTSLVISFLAFQTQGGLTWKPLSKKDAGKIFERTSAIFREMDSYTLRVSQCSYTDYQAMHEYEKQSGYFKKSGANYHSFLLGIHTIQNKKYKVVLDTASKTICLNNPDHAMESGMNQQQYSLMLNHFESLKVSDGLQEKHLRIEYPEGDPFHAAEITLGNDTLVKEINYYYSHAVHSDPNDKNSAKNKPRVKITFSDFKKNQKLNYSEEFDESKYVVLAAGTKPQLTAKYKNYRLRDQRFQETKK